METLLRSALSKMKKADKKKKNDECILSSPSPHSSQMSISHQPASLNPNQRQHFLCGMGENILTKNVRKKGGPGINSEYALISCSRKL